MVTTRAGPRISPNARFQEVFHRGVKVRSDIIFRNPSDQKTYRVKGVTGRALTQQELIRQVQTGGAVIDKGPQFTPSRQLERAISQSKIAERREAKLIREAKRLGVRPTFKTVRAAQEREKKQQVKPIRQIKETAPTRKTITRKVVKKTITKTKQIPIRGITRKDVQKLQGIKPSALESGKKKFFDTIDKRIQQGEDVGRYIKAQRRLGKKLNKSEEAALLLSGFQIAGSRALRGITTPFLKPIQTLKGLKNLGIDVGRSIVKLKPTGTVEGVIDEFIRDPAGTTIEMFAAGKAFSIAGRGGAAALKPIAKTSVGKSASAFATRTANSIKNNAKGLTKAVSVKRLFRAADKLKREAKRSSFKNKAATKVDTILKKGKKSSSKSVRRATAKEIIIKLETNSRVLKQLKKNRTTTLKELRKAKVSKPQIKNQIKNIDRKIKGVRGGTKNLNKRLLGLKLSAQQRALIRRGVKKPKIKKPKRETAKTTDLSKVKLTKGQARRIRKAEGRAKARTRFETIPIRQLVKLIKNKKINLLKLPKRARARVRAQLQKEAKLAKAGRDPVKIAIRKAKARTAKEKATRTKKEKLAQQIRQANRAKDEIRKIKRVMQRTEIRQRDKIPTKSRIVIENKKVKSTLKKATESFKEIDTGTGEKLLLKPPKLKQVESKLKTITQAKTKASAKSAHAQAKQSSIQINKQAIGILQKAKTKAVINFAKSSSVYAIALSTFADSLLKSRVAQLNKSKTIQTTRQDTKQETGQIQKQGRKVAQRQRQIIRSATDTGVSQAQAQAIATSLIRLSVPKLKIRIIKIHKTPIIIKGLVRKKKLTKKEIIQIAKRLRRFVFQADLVSRLFGIRASKKETKRLLKVGRVFTGLERRPLVSQRELIKRVTQALKG